MAMTTAEADLLVRALDSYIRRMIRDYNHKDRQGASSERLQAKQARIEAAKELRERIKHELSKIYLHG